MNEALKLEAVKDHTNQFKIIEQSDKIKRDEFEFTSSDGIMIRSVALPEWKSDQQMLFIRGHKPEDDKKLIYIPSDDQKKVFIAIAELNIRLSKTESELEKKDKSTPSCEDATLTEIKTLLKFLNKARRNNEIDLFALRTKGIGLTKKIRALKRAITAYEKEMRK